MSEAFLKALKWYILVGCAIIGTSAFIISDNTGSTKPMIIGVLGYGVVYIMSYFWKEFRQKLLLYSIIVFLALSFLSPKIPIWMYIFFNYNPASFDPYFTWAATVGVLGIPIMTFIFKKYD
ncbi:MAG: hypothetical protein COB14_01695 [Alphaproteobacteria bacterium]|nr:MAG: hypothetical protein COB14_01695 [Alphaproteobacteria bacterium]